MFPMNCADNILDHTDNPNHKSARDHPKAIAEFIEQQKQVGTIAGPIPENVFRNIHKSPLMTKPKDKTKRRVIVDMSWPPNGG